MRTGSIKLKAILLNLARGSEAAHEELGSIAYLLPPIQCVTSFSVSREVVCGELCSNWVESWNLALRRELPGTVRDLTGNTEGAQPARPDRAYVCWCEEAGRVNRGY